MTPAPSSVVPKGPILFVHNAYREAGGEETVIRTLRRTLERNGHPTEIFERRSDDFLGAPFLSRALSTLQIPFSFDVYSALRKKIRETGARLVHAHNIFPFISPSVYAAARRASVPVVHTLHNYRTLCVNGLFLRDGKPCERCIGGNTLHAIGGRCLGGSLSQSAVMAANLFFQRAANTWRRGADAYIALSAFSKRKLVEGGLPGERIEVMPNFLDMADYPFEPKPENYILFLGRLSREKGLETLLRAYEILASRTAAPALEIIGDGPLQGFLTEFMKGRPSLALRWHGRLDGKEKIEKLKRAALLVFPSECYENCPLAVMESLAVGTPVAGSRLGGTQELIRDGETGVLFAAGDPSALAKSLESLLADSRGLMAMRARARKAAEECFDAQAGIANLVSLYDRLLSHSPLH